MNRNSLKAFFALVIILSWTITLMAQDVLENNVYRVTAFKKGNNQITSTSNYAEVIPPVNIYIPNAFTPNGDGINGVFMPGWNMKVYNRNGILVYEGDKGWDGTVTLEYLPDYHDRLIPDRQRLQELFG